MSEIYSFTARVVCRQKRRIRISPDNPDAFLDYLGRVGLSRIIYWNAGTCCIWVTNPKMIEAANGADRVQYSVEKRTNRLFPVKMEPLG